MAKAKDETIGTNKQKGKKVCTCCHKERNLTDYYISYSPLYSIDKRVPICKECCKTLALNEDGSINEVKLNELLRNIDRPYYKDLIFVSEQSVKRENGYLSDEEVKYHGREILQAYFRQIATRQDRARSYSDSERDNFIHDRSNRPVSEKNKISKEYTDIKTELSGKGKASNKKIFKENEEQFEVTQEILDLFGEGYSLIEYKNMYKKYLEMRDTYVIQTNIHKEALLTYVRFKVKEELATASGDVEEARKWYGAAQDAATKAKLTPQQLSKADLQGGITNFSDIFKAVEESNERIPIFPEFKYRPNDAVDFIIWCYINYERNLNNMPEVPYSDIYKFYDEKKQEYIDMYGDPYGIFKDDPTLNNRETVEKFITVPPEFRDN